MNENLIMKKGKLIKAESENKIWSEKSQKYVSYKRKPYKKHPKFRLIKKKDARLIDKFVGGNVVITYSNNGKIEELTGTITSTDQTHCIFIDNSGNEYFLLIDNVKELRKMLEDNVEGEVI